MRLAKHALLIALVTLATIFAVSAQTMKSPEDARNTAPTVGTGGTTGGPTGLFTVYDGQTLRKGEFTFSLAYSNFDRDPGNVDITEVPVSFQIGLSDHLELFFNTDAYRGIKVNNPQNLSSFYLPNSQLNGVLPAAIVLAPGTAGTFANGSVYRPAGMPFVQFPYSGGNAGTYGFTPPFFSGNIFGFANNANATLGPPRAGGAADNFPGVGSPFGSILPGIVLSTQNLTCVGGQVCGTAPVVYSSAPSYLPDAPFINRKYGTSAFSTYNAGLKWRFTSPENPIGFGVVVFYRWYNDTGSDAAGFNQLQRGASPGGNRGDIGTTLFFDNRIAKWANFSANLGYIYNSSSKGNFANGTFTMLDRPDELNYAVGLDFPVNQYFQPIVEYRQTKYVGGRTVNVFENDPLDLLAGVRIYPRRWFGFGLAYRYHANSQDNIKNATYSQSVTTYDYPRIIANAGAGIVGPGNIVAFQTVTSTGNLANAFRTSSDPHGFIVQFWAGRRNERGAKPIPNGIANVDSVTLDSSEVVLPCAPGTVSVSGACKDDQSVAVATKATDPDGDTLTYSYTVSGGRVVGQGANVNWDLSGVKAGSYTITSAVDDGCGFCGKTQTQTITVVECKDCKPVCNCPSSITVTGPSGITSINSSMTFTANVNGGTQDNLTFKWTVNGVVSDQTSSTISVPTNADMYGQTVTATVEVGGLCDGCPNSASSSGEVEVRKDPPVYRVVDELGKANNDEIKAKLDGLFNELNADPTSTGMIINEGSTKEIVKREKVISDHIRFRGFDSNRITVTRRSGTGINSTFFVIPAGATPPQ